MTTAAHAKADALVLSVPLFDPTTTMLVHTTSVGLALADMRPRPQIESRPEAARALVGLRAAQTQMSRARADAEEAAEGLEITEALHACRIVSPHELCDAMDRERRARARLFDAEFELAVATMRAFAATGHVGRIAIQFDDEAA